MPQPLTTWRLINTGPLTGTENMAIDEALLDCFDPERSLPLLRLYGWNPPAFSHGRFQQPAEIINLRRCCDQGVAVVRRITGGGVIYHGAELTYALVCPVSFIPSGRGVKEAFFHLTSFLISFYRRLGLSAVHAADYYGAGKRLGIRTPLCFAGIESCDILLDGRKIGGNAQRRLKNVIFQHGSIPLRPMEAESAPLLLDASTATDSATTSLAGEGITADIEELSRLLAASFASQFNISFFPDTLSNKEKNTANEYMLKTE